MGNKGKKEWKRPDFEESIETFNRLIGKARETNRRRDELDRKSGFAAPIDCDPMTFVRTAMIAIQTGIISKDWDCIAEGYDMLNQFVDKYVAITLKVHHKGEKRGDE